MGEVIELFPSSKVCACGWKVPTRVGYEASLSMKDTSGVERIGMFNDAIKVKLKITMRCPQCSNEFGVTWTEEG